MNLKLKLLLFLTIVSTIFFLGHIASAYFDISLFPSTPFNALDLTPAPTTPHEVDEFDDEVTPLSSRTCNQCVGGNFLMRKWLMQDNRVAQRMGWVDEWAETDCLKGNVNYYHHCHTTCLTIEIQKRVDVPKGIYDSIMMDCADDLIYNSPDIPRDGYKHEPIAMVFENDETFVNDRLGYRITYKFTTANSIDPKRLAIEFQQKVHPGFIIPKTTIATNHIYTIIIGVFVALLIGVTYITWRCSNRPKVTDWQYTGNPYWHTAVDSGLNHDRPSDPLVQLHVNQARATYRRAPFVSSENVSIYDPHTLQMDSYDEVWNHNLNPQDEVIDDAPLEHASVLKTNKPSVYSSKAPTRSFKQESDESSIKTVQENSVKAQINDHAEGEAEGQARDTDDQTADAAENDDNQDTPILAVPNNSSL
uniref:Transmembrane protein n=1 Tax=Caenorhabditis tropicalis TaxID=1561998 RepID=A0A1I7U0I2_9PELO